MTAHDAFDRNDPHAPEVNAPGDRYAAAYRRVQELRAFYAHALWFAVLIPAMSVLNGLTSPQYWWVVWPFVGWGIGLTIHGFSVFAGDRFLGREWQERKIRQILEQEGATHGRR